MAKREATSKARRDAPIGATSHRPFAKLAEAARSAPPSSAPPSARPGSSRGTPAGVVPEGAATAEESESARAEEERRRFAQLMRGVRPLAGAPVGRAPAAARAASRDGAKTPAVDADAGARQRLEALVAEGVRFEVFDDGDTLEGRRLDVDPREIRKLRQLRYSIDGTLDLHGLASAEARTKLEAFLRRRRLQGDRAVVIVHGKGLHSPRGIAILRGEIAAWLSQGKAQRDVAAFASVTDRLGGTGSVCVLLAR